MPKQILIGCPVSNRAWILPYYLRNLYNLDYPKENIDLFWIVNQSKDDSANILNKFKKEHENEYNSITIKFCNPDHTFVDIRETTIRMKHTYKWLAKLRNIFSGLALNMDVDYFLSCDCDILLPKNALSNLVNCNKDYVAGLIYNGYIVKPDEPWEFPNILNSADEPRKYKHIVNYRTKNPETNQSSYCFPVDFTGAVFLISKKACKFLRFEEHPQGEDEPACFNLRCSGVQLYCNPATYCQHVMSEKLLDQFKNFGV